MQFEIDPLLAAKGVVGLAAAWDCEEPKTTEQAKRLGLVFATNFFPSRVASMKQIAWHLTRCFDKQLDKNERALAYTFELEELIDQENELYAETVLTLCVLIRISPFVFVGCGVGPKTKNGIAWTLVSDASNCVLLGKCRFHRVTSA